MKLAFALLGSVCAAAVSSPVFAQERAVTEGAAASTGTSVPATPDAAAPIAGDIIVTAARHSQSLQKVSATVDVLGGQALAQSATVNMMQALASTPGVNTTTQPGGSSINIRGLGADTPTGTTQGAVALEFDGVYSILALGTSTGLFDVNRIEVLKGPQGTRYGPNAEGGVVNVITNEPVLGDRSGHASLTVGNFGLVRGEVAQTIPIGDKIALRIAGAAVHRDSYFSPDAGNNVAHSLRLKLLAQPSDDLTIRLGYQIDHIGGTGNGSEASYPIVINKVAPYSGDSINDHGNPWHHGDSCGGVACSKLDSSNVAQQTFTAATTYDIADAVVLDVSGAYTSIKGHDYNCTHNGPPWTVSQSADAGVTCGTVHSYAPFNQYSAEARLHSAARSKVQWDLGYYFFDYSQYKWDDSFEADSAGKAGGTKLGTRTNAVFGEATYPVTDRLRLIGGARYSWDERILKPFNVATTYKANLSHFDFRAGEEFDVSPNVMQYFTVSSGYRPGGLTYDGGAGTATLFKSEQTRAYEFGLKSRLLNNRLTLNLSGFYYDQKNYQDIDTYAGFDDGTGYICQNGSGQPAACSVPTFNIKNAYNLGLEWQARLQATDNDAFGFNGTLMKARFNKKQGTCATIAAPTTAGCWIGYNDQETGALEFYNAAGSSQPHAPTLAFAVNYAHTFRFASGSALTVGGDAYHSSGYWVHPVHDAAKLGYQPAYWQENLNASFTNAPGWLTVSAFLKNLSNYAVKESTLPATAIGDPRTYGVTVALKW